MGINESDGPPPDMPLPLPGSPEPMRLRQRPEGVVPSTLDVFEGFFGAEVDEAMLEELDHLPTDQAQVLWDRLRDHWLTVWDVLALRTGGDPNMFARFGVTPEMRQPYEDLLKGEITVADAEQNNQADIASRGSLKHAVLYSGRTLVADPMAMIMPSADLSGLRDGLRQMIDVADLVRAGALVPVPLSQSIDVAAHSNWDINDPITREHVQWLAHKLQGRQLDDNELAPYMKLVAQLSTVGHWEPSIQDPYIQKILRGSGLHVGSLVDNAAPWTAERADELERLATDTILRHYENRYGINAEQLIRIRNFTLNLRYLRLSPIVTDPAVAYHLEQCAHVWLEGQPIVPQASPLSHAVQYQVPALSEVSFADIASMRRDEEVFRELRTALETLGQACATDLERSGTPASLQAYKELVRANASDIVGPAHAKLQKLKRSATFRQFFTAAGIKLVTLGLDGLIGPLSEVFGMVAENGPGHQAEHKKQVSHLAAGIIRSVMHY